MPGENPWGKGFGSEGNSGVVFFFNSNLQLSFVLFLMSSPCYQISFGSKNINSGVLELPVGKLGNS